MCSWKHTPHFIRINKFFVVFFKCLGSKCQKLLLNAHFGPQMHALGAILPTVSIESGLKGFFTVCGDQHLKRYQSERQNRQFRESEDSVFFSKTGVISQMRETSFLF